MYRAIVCRGRQDKNAGSRQIADQLISFSLSLSFRGSNCFDIAFTGFDSLAAARCIFFPQSIVAAYLARDREQPKSDICYATFILSLFSRFFFFFSPFRRDATQQTFVVVVIAYPCNSNTPWRSGAYTISIGSEYTRVRSIRP